MSRRSGRLTAAQNRRANAAATRAILERRQRDGDGWVTSLQLVAAGITNPRQAVADVRNAGVELDERVVRMYMAWRLREQLPQQRDAERLGSDE